MSKNNVIQESFKAAFLNSISDGKIDAARTIAVSCIPPEFKLYPALSAHFVEACIETKTLYFPGSEFLEAIASGKVDPAEFPPSAMIEFFQMHATLPNRKD